MSGKNHTLIETIAKHLTESLVETTHMPAQLVFSLIGFSYFMGIKVDERLSGNNKNLNYFSLGKSKPVHIAV